MSAAARSMSAPAGAGHKLTDGVREGDPNLTWFLLRSATAREARAEESLVDAGLAVYVPRLARWRRLGRVKRRVERPLIAGYLFAGLSPEHDLYDIEALEGVHAAVRFARDRGPYPVPFGDIRRVLECELAGEFDATVRRAAPLPKEGDQVHIVGGKFQGFPATFVKLKPNKRVEVLMQVFGRWSPTTLKAGEVGEIAERDA